MMKKKTTKKDEKMKSNNSQLLIVLRYLKIYYDAVFFCTTNLSFSVFLFVVNKHILYL